MVLSRKFWRAKHVDVDLINELAGRHGLSFYAVLVAVSKGIDNDEKIREFFKTGTPLSSPFDIPDMDKAVKAIEYSLDHFERIAVSGDYDADGITATALLYSYLEEQGADVICRIPDRNEGYGLSTGAIDEFAQQGVKLIVTVDCGISCIEEAEYCRKKGIKLVVTDHHLCGETLPDCEAVVNPHREDCKLKFKELAGVGVAFKLVCALEGGEGEDVLDHFGDLVTIGTVGDVMPLLEENRTIVRTGMKIINSYPCQGITALREASGNLGKRIKASDLSFSIIPRINAAGRMGSPSRALALLLEQDDVICRDIAAEISAANVERHKAEGVIIDEIKTILKERPELQHQRIIVLDGEGWHPGVLGIVASRLVDRFGKPAIVISRDGEIAKGSGRSLETFSMYDAIKSCEDMLDHFGGHTLAAGLGLKSENIELFRKRINDYAATVTRQFPVLELECCLMPKAISLDLVDALSTLEPFGAGNSQPLFGICNMTLDELQPVGEGKHTRVVTSRDGVKITAMKFGTPANELPFEPGDVIDLAVTLEKNEYLGEVKPSVRIKDMRLSDVEDIKVLRGMNLFDKIMRGDELSEKDKEAALPDREYMLKVYKYIRSRGSWRYGIETLCFRLGNKGSDYAKTAVAVEAMLELGVLIKDEGVISLPDKTVKTDLMNSKLLARLK